MVLKGKKAHARIRLLLTLWELCAVEAEVGRGEITRKIVRKGEKMADYQELFDELMDGGTIAIPRRNKIAIDSEQVRDLLGSALQDEDFEFKAQIGRNAANALLRLIREGTKAGVSVDSKPATEAAKITSYEEFKQVALTVYDSLNRDFNLDNLVPIYRIRREIGDRVSRSEFNEWLLKMQENDVLQLLEGSVEDGAPDKIEDSITTKVSGLRCYAKRLNG
ncbi:MAG TPA: hypothetical protein V6D18_01405 [Thermosynechococcaceae cyanobacterium]